jgi:hypothetical protein
VSSPDDTLVALDDLEKLDRGGGGRVTTSTEDGTDFIVTLANAGIACPPTGVQALEIRAFGPWHWGTAELDAFGLYMFDVETVTRHLIDDGPVFAPCHAGHGINSYGLNLVTCAGPVAVFVQHHYIGVYADGCNDFSSGSVP